MRKAQLMIEYMVILVIMLLLFNSISLDLINTSTEDATFLQIAEMINASKIVVLDATKMISLQGAGARKIVLLRAPPDCDYLSGVNTVIVQCDPISRFYENFSGQMITPSGFPKVSFSIETETGTITSGNIVKVIVSKT